MSPPKCHHGQIWDSAVDRCEDCAKFCYQAVQQGMEEECRTGCPDMFQKPRAGLPIFGEDSDSSRLNPGIVATIIICAAAVVIAAILVVMLRYRRVLSRTVRRNSDVEIQLDDINIPSADPEEVPPAIAETNPLSTSEVHTGVGEMGKYS